VKLQGRVALITGAGSGLGREIALTFAREGARIAVNDVRRETAQAVCDEIRRAGGEALALRADVSDSVEVAAMFEQLVDQCGRLDILVNNAGIAVMTDAVKAKSGELIQQTLSGQRPTESVGATRHMTDAQWRRTLAIHLDGTFCCTREALKIMEPQRSGKIINMASIAGLLGLAIAPDYCAAKAGIIGFTKAVAREVAACGIYVNAIAPGFIDTPLLDPLDETMKMMIVVQTPLGRLGTPQEVAAVALYLASDESSFTIGQVISPNGGLYI
jgi:NAD(P)-dependent dehydrogenase (short-subunit alcohol dehydrogenase family)